MKDIFWVVALFIVFGVGYVIGTTNPNVLQRAGLRPEPVPHAQVSENNMVVRSADSIPAASAGMPIPTPITTGDKSSMVMPSEHPGIAGTLDITVPTDGDEFCYGEYVPVKWTAPAGVDYAYVWLSSPNTSTQIGIRTGIKDDPSPMHAYEFYWNGSNTTINKFVPEGHMYQISVAAYMKDKKIYKGTSNGRFSYIDCHTGVRNPPPTK